MARLPLRHRPALAGLLAAFLLLATLYNAVSTPFEAPDEIGHFYYVVHLLQARQLPVVPATDPPSVIPGEASVIPGQASVIPSGARDLSPNYEQEGIQPPLYYAGAAALLRLLEWPLRLDLHDASLNAPLDVNPHSACARPGARYNVTYLAHDPHQERFPYQGRVRALHVVRLWSSLLGAATVAGVFAVARLAFPGTPAAAWLAASLTAFTPEFLFTAGAVSNDNLVTALSTWGLYLALRTLRDGLRWRVTAGLGILAGLAALSKLSGALLLPLACLAILVVSTRHRGRPASAGTPPANQQISKSANPQSRPAIRYLLFAICHLLFAICSFLLTSGWWFLRNWTLYGDPTGTRPMLDMLPLRHEMSVGTLIRELPGLFRSWWGTFGCTAPPAVFFLLYLALVLGGLAGLLAARRRLAGTWPQVGVLVAWLALLSLAYARWNWVIHAPKGRLLYPAMASVAGFLGLGWAHWAARWRWLVLALPILLVAAAGAIPFAILAPPVAPPPIYAAPADVQPAHPLDGRFGPAIVLLGYDLNDTSFEPGEWLDLTLYWQALARPADHYTLAIQLVTAVPGEMDTLINFNTWTGGGNYPTGLWHTGDVIADRYRLRLPGEVPRAQGWYLLAALFDTADGTRLPLTLGGQPAGEGAKLALLRVGASHPAVQAPSEADRLAAPVTFDGTITLEGARMVEEGEALKVTLWWRCVTAPTGDRVVFVHLYDAEGLLVATADGPPLAGGFPTSLWRPGDRVRDEHVTDPKGLPRPLGSVGVGWYDPLTGARLAATTADGVRLPNDEFLLPSPW